MSNWLAGPFQHFLEPLSVPAELDFNGPRCAHVRQFFKKFDLDPNNLRHWHLLIWDLAGKPRGRPSKWKKLEGLYVLRLQVDLMKHADPTKDDAQCCIELTKKKGKNKKSPTQTSNQKHWNAGCAMHANPNTRSPIKALWIC